MPSSKEGSPNRGGRCPSRWWNDDCAYSGHCCRRDERHKYADLRGRKRFAFWTSRVEADQSQPRRLSRSFNDLLGLGSLPPPNVAANDLHRFFDDKVAGVRLSIAGADPPVFTLAPPGTERRVFVPVSIADVTGLVRSLPDKQCTSDPLPTWLLKANVDALAPPITHHINLSLEYSNVPTVLKSAYVTPLLKRVGLDPSDVKSCRPISNLLVVSKLLERVVAGQLIEYLRSSDLLPNLQSAYRANNLTETTVVKVLADILMAPDSGDFALLTLLGLSAAFDCVDHETLLRRLRCSYGLNGAVLDWVSSYLQRRVQHVRTRTSSFTPSPVLCGVPQGRYSDRSSSSCTPQTSFS